MSGAPVWASPSRLLRRFAGEASPRPGIVNHVSLGTVCHMASVLRDLGLRRWTGPFDWVLSTPALVADCLREDFRSYLDPALLRSVPETERTGGAKRQCRHPTIEARYGVPILFNHHDPLTSEVDRRALTRAVARLRAILESGHDNVFYLMAVDFDLPAAEIQALGRLLATFPSRNALVTVTVSAGDDGRRELVVEPEADFEVLGVALRLRSGSPWRGLSFAEAADDALLAQGVIQASAALVSAWDGHATSLAQAVG